MQSARRSKMSRNRPNLSYVVAFALKETYDDLVTAQQMICKRSPQESTNSITPTNSIKMIESEQVEKLEQIIDESQNDTKNEEILDETKNIPAQEKEIMNENDVTEITNDCEKIVNCVSYDPPEVIFNAINYGQKYSQNRYLKRKPKGPKKINAMHKIHKYTKPKRNKFESTISKNILSNRLEQYYEKVKQNNYTEPIQRGILKKVLAKENLLAEIELLSISNNNIRCNENYNFSLSSESNNSKTGSFISNSSGKTLIQQISITGSSLNEDTYSTGTVKSAIRIDPDKSMPYKTDVINVAVAVAYNKSKVNTLNEELLPSQGKFCLTNLTSSETLTEYVGDLTSNPPTDIEPCRSVDTRVLQSKLSPNKISSFEVSSNDTVYDMARTSSDFNNLSTDTSYTLKNESETLIDIETTFLVNDKSQLQSKNILQRVIDLGYYPEVTASTSSAGNVNSGRHDVLVTGLRNQDYTINANNKGDNDNQPSPPKHSILRKPFEQRDDSPPVSNLLNQTQIRALLTNSSLLTERSYLEESKHPSNIPELWDRLVLALDLTFKRLEETITDNIIKEMKKAFASLDRPAPKQIDENIENGISIFAMDQPSNKVRSVQKVKAESDQGLQCNLVQNNIIDQIMSRISDSQGPPKVIEPRTSMQSFIRAKREKRFRDYFEVLKPPVPSPLVLVDKGDTVTISTVTENNFRFGRLKAMISGPVAFVRENLFVITTVPAFFAVLLLIYGVLLLLLKPW